jgi:hypothetical protein
MSMIAKCTPSLGNVSLWWTRATESIAWPTGGTGKAIFYLRDGVGGEIAEVRNGIVDAVLEYDRTTAPVSHLFWIDDDVLVFPGCLLELLHQRVDICSGVYFTKMPGHGSEPLIYPERNGGADSFRPNEAYDVWGHGMGLTLVRTDVYKRMRDELKLPPDKYGRPSWYHTTKLDEEIRQDETGILQFGWTEDLWFLENASKLGYKPRVVTTKHAFGFHYDARADKGYPEEQWKQWIAGEAIVWQTPDGPVTWN